MITKFNRPVVSYKEYVNLLIIRQNATLYLEQIIPISKDDGFIQCEYDDDDSDKFILISFYFNQNTQKDIFRKFKKFLNVNDLKIFDKVAAKHEIEYRVKLYNDRIEEYSDLYTNIKNFNL